MKGSFKEIRNFYFKKLFLKLFNRQLWWRTGINTFVGVLHPLMAVIILKYILDLIKEGNITSSQLIVIASIYTVVFILAKSLNIFLGSQAELIIMKDRNDLLIDMVEKIMFMDFKHFEDPKFELRANQAFMGAGGDNYGYQEVLTTSFNLIPDLLLLLIFGIIIASQSILVFIIIILTTILNFYMATRTANYSNKKELERRNERRKYERYKDVGEDFNYGKDIRIFNLKNRLLNNIKHFMNRMLDVNYLVAKYRFKISFIENFSLSIGDLAALTIFTYMTINGVLTIGDLITLLTMITVLSGIVMDVSQSINRVFEHTNYTKFSYDFLDENLIENSKGISKKFNGPVNIRFDNVSFKYPGSEEYVFKNLSFNIESGKKIAIVGVNGAGKTTIVKLLTGLYRPESGAIYIDGINADDLDQQSRFRLFSVVFQETSPIALTIAENIAGVENNIDRERVKYTLETVGLWDKVNSFDNGIDQNVLKVIYEDGVILSGGENQKLMIARALYKKESSVMVMDEPTSALDALAEEKIYQEFDSYMGNKTGIFISHRLASTKFCDEILFLDGGEISNSGTHEELLKSSDKYREMFETQGKYYKEELNENL